MIDLSFQGLTGRGCRCYGFDAKLPKRLAQLAVVAVFALACGPAPEGQQHWTLRLLADKMVDLEYVDQVSHETVRQALKKMNSSPG